MIIPPPTSPKTPARGGCSRRLQTRADRPKNRQFMPAPIARSPHDRLSGRQANQSGADRRQNRNLAFRNVSIAWEDKHDCFRIAGVRLKRYCRTHLDDVGGNRAVGDDSRSIKFREQFVGTIWTPGRDCGRQRRQTHIVRLRDFDTCLAPVFCAVLHLNTHALDRSSPGRKDHLVGGLVNGIALLNAPVCRIHVAIQQKCHMLILHVRPSARGA